MTDEYFRGMTGITEIAKKAKPLAEWLAKFKPGSPMRMAPKDFDLVARYPKAASMCGFRVVDKTVTMEVGGVSVPVLRHVGEGRYREPSPLSERTEHG